MPKRPPKPPDRAAAPRFRSRAKAKDVPRTQMPKGLRALLAKRPQALTALKTIDDYEAGKISKGDDRGMILVCAALLEQTLEEAILIHCIKPYDKLRRDQLFGSESAALGSFYAKIVMGHALGIYGDLFRQDLDRIRQIRNVFAHGKARMHIDSPAIREAIEGLHILGPRFFNATKSERLKTTRAKFLDAIGMSMVMLYVLTKRNRHLRPRNVSRRGTYIHESP